LANAVAFATDPYFKNRYQAVDEAFSGWSPYRSEESEDVKMGSRYVQW
jgi:hypothetical protein